VALAYIEKEALALIPPDDVSTAGPMPMYLAMANLQSDNNLPVFPFITSPIEGARSLCGPENLMRWMLKKPELAHHILRLATDYSVAVVRYFAASFPPEEQLIFVAAPTASNQMISPKLFETYVLPYQHELHSKTLETGIRHIVCHICGEQNLNLPLWKQIPMGNPGVVSFGHEVDLNAAVKLFGDSSIIAGNVSPALIHMGPADEVYRISWEALEKGRKAACGFILMPGCGIPWNVPAYHLHMFKKAHTDWQQEF
jgi:uroporphyrinogen decarboxylase